MSNKFITFIPGYSNATFNMLNDENYFIWPSIAMIEAWYEAEMILYKTNYDISKEDPSYDNRIKLIYTKNPFFVIYYLLKNRNEIIYSNTLTILSLIIWIIWKKTIFMPHSLPISNNIIKKYVSIFFYLFFKKIRIINNYEKDLLVKNWIKNWIKIPLVISETFLKNNIKNNTCNILIFWNITNIKDPITILKALKLVIYKYPEIKIEQIWNYKEFAYKWKTYLELLEEYWLIKNFYLHWVLKQKEIIEKDFNTWIYLNSSLQEWQCLAVYESALMWNALCLPKITAFYWVFWENSLLHETWNFETLAKNIIFYIENPEIRKHHVENNQNFVLKNYSYENISKLIKKEFTNF